MKFTEVLSQEIFEKDKFFDECHASTILKYNNKLLCAWFAGTKEGNDDVKIFLSQNENGIWSNPVQMSQNDNTPCWNPVLFEKDGVIFLFYKSGKKIPTWKTYIRISKDAGETWSDSSELVPGDRSGSRGPVKNKPILLTDGTIAAPASVETARYWDAFVDISRDNCKTWERSNFIPFDHKHSDGKGIIQPTLWENDGTLYAMLRSSESSIMRSFTNDLKTWSECKKTSLPNNNSGIDCVKLNNENIFVVFNPIASDWGSRNIIAYAVSPDNGENFSEPVVIELDENTDAEFSYPAVISDGKYVYITYTHYRKSIMFRKFKINQ
jgi:predicted neuraminidase